MVMVDIGNGQETLNARICEKMSHTFGFSTSIYPKMANAAIRVNTGPVKVTNLG